MYDFEQVTWPNPKPFPVLKMGSMACVLWLMRVWDEMMEEHCFLVAIADGRIIEARHIQMGPKGSCGVRGMSVVIFATNISVLWELFILYDCSYADMLLLCAPAERSVTLLVYRKMTSRKKFISAPWALVWELGQCFFLSQARRRVLGRKQRPAYEMRGHTQIIVTLARKPQKSITVINFLSSFPFLQHCHITKRTRKTKYRLMYLYVALYLAREVWTWSILNNLSHNRNGFVVWYV